MKNSQFDMRCLFVVKRAATISGGPNRTVPMPRSPQPRPTAPAAVHRLQHRKDVHGRRRRSVCPEVRASGARAQAGVDTPQGPLTSSGTLHHCVNRPGEVAPLALPLHKGAMTRSRELVNPPTATIDLRPPAGQCGGPYIRIAPCACRRTRYNNGPAVLLIPIPCTCLG
jgi:hypothetical protein